MQGFVDDLPALLLQPRWKLLGVQLALYLSSLPLTVQWLLVAADRLYDDGV